MDFLPEMQCSYSPCILSVGVVRDRQHSPHGRQAQSLATYRWLRVNSGTIKGSYGGTHHGRFVARPGEQFLWAPGHNVFWDAAPGLCFTFCDFLVTPAPLQCLRAPSWELVTVTAQPSPREVWGCNLAAQVPAGPDRIRLGRQLESIHVQWAQGEDGRRMAHAQLAVALAIAIPLLRREESVADVPTNTPITTWRSQALAYITNHLADPAFGVPQLAMLIGCSPSQLHRRLCAEPGGMAPGALIRTLRIQAACRLLRQTKLSIREIAHKVGYENSANFSTAFCRSIGQAPGEYRQSSGESALFAERSLPVDTQQDA